MEGVVTRKYVLEVRSRIKKDIIEGVFADRGGKETTRINGSDLDRISELYDRYIFRNQIKKMAAQQNRYIQYTTTKRT